MHGPIMSEPYYEPYVVRHPLDYRMARAYSGGYIGPGASKVNTTSGNFFLSFNSPTPSPALSAPSSFLSHSLSPLQPPVLQTPAPAPTPVTPSAFPSSPPLLPPYSVSALRPPRPWSSSFSYCFLSFSCFSFSISSTSLSPPPLSLALLLLLYLHILLLLRPNLQPRPSILAKVRPWYESTRALVLVFLQQSANRHLVSVLLYFQDVLRRGQTPYVRKAFLSPDMTAVIDRDVVDGSAKGPPKSI